MAYRNIFETAGVVEFTYNGKSRIGTVERFAPEKGYVTIRHSDPQAYDGKVYSTYKLSKIESGPREVGG